MARMTTACRSSTRSSFQGTTPASDFSANGYSQVWDEISAGALSNTFASICHDDGAALEWNVVVSNQPVTIDTGVSFTGQAVPVGAAVPALSLKGLIALVGLLRRGGIRAREEDFRWGRREEARAGRPVRAMRAAVRPPFLFWAAAKRRAQGPGWSRAARSSIRTTGSAPAIACTFGMAPEDSGA